MGVALALLLGVTICMHNSSYALSCRALLWFLDSALNSSSWNVVGALVDLDTHTELSFLRISKSWSSFQGAFPLLQARDTFLHLYECICYHGNETITLFQGRWGKKVRRAPFPESSLLISSVSPLLIRTQLFRTDFLPSSILPFTCQGCLLSPSQSA